MKIDESLLLSKFNYDPDTGLFTWLNDSPGRGKVKAGQRAGSSLHHPDGKAYRRLCINSQYMYEHRAAFVFMDCPLTADEEVDHENGNGEDNRWLNIKRSSRKVNAKNLRRRKNNKSGVNGVHYHKKRCKWVAMISINNLTKNLGGFDSFEEAVAVRRQAEIDNNFHNNHGSDRPL